MKKTNHKILFHSLSLLFLSAFFCFLSSCEVKAQQKPTKSETEAIIEIDANYMKEHIYDFEANPTSFVYKGNIPAIIDFYATWCGPCRALAPKLQKLTKEYEGKFVVYKVDIDKNPTLAELFGVKTIPTMIFVPLKEKPYLSTGNLPMEGLRRMVEKILP